MKIIDTFPAFLDFWEDYQALPLEQQIDGWAGNYLSQWSEILHKQIEHYEQRGYDWREIAKLRIFPTFEKHLPTIVNSYQHLSKLCEPVFNKIRDQMKLDIDVTFVMHVGIGCGVGWVTTYNGSPAVLFGLEQIAEKGWNQPKTLAGLIIHVMVHLAHFQWRDEAGLAKGSGPWWQLYTEGFAQWCQNEIMPGFWHIDSREQNSWLQWCQQNAPWLAREFLRRSNSAEDVRGFFDSWFTIQWYKESGYFLGSEIINNLKAEIPVMEIALLKDYETPFKSLMKTWAKPY